MNTTKQKILLLSLIGVLLFTGSAALAQTGTWREPGCAPTGCNTPEPINISSSAQTKTGVLGLGGLILSSISDLVFGVPAGPNQFLTTDSQGRAMWRTVTGTGGPGGPGEPGQPGDSFWQAISNGIRYMDGNVGIRSNPGNDQLFINGTTRVQGDFFLGSFAQPALHTASGNLHINPASSGGYSNVILNRNNNGSVGIRKDPSSAYSLDVAGGINASRLCINGDCRTNWSGVSGSSGDSFPAGSIVMSLGACPAGWLHDARFNTRFPVGGVPGSVRGTQDGTFPSHTSGVGEIGGVQLSFITPLVAPILLPTWRAEIPSVSVYFCVKQ